MVDIRKKIDCCGCGACMQVCQQKAITMVYDEKGFKYPRIDYELCSNCGRCDRVCQFCEDYRNNGDNPEVYAVIHKNENVRKTSTSGGAFTAISDYILENGGAVYGTCFDENLVLCHQRATEKEHRDKFKGSKYIQSDIGNTYALAKDDLNDGKLVLFSGTPCQIAGLYGFLGKEYENLYTVDLVCHGVPSPELWRKFVGIMEKKAKDVVVGAEFRNKDIDWRHPIPKLLYKNRKTSVFGENAYYSLFVTDYMLRESCYNCKFANYSRPSDITMGDFWGIEKSMPEIDDNKGVSLVLANSKKGLELIESLPEEDVSVYKSNRDSCDCGQFRHPSFKNKRYEDFWNDYFKYDMKYVLKKYTNFTKTKYFFFRINRRLKLVMKKLGR